MHNLYSLIIHNTNLSDEYLVNIFWCDRGKFNYWYYPCNSYNLSWEKKLDFQITSTRCRTRTYAFCCSLWYKSILIWPSAFIVRTHFLKFLQHLALAWGSIFAQHILQENIHHSSSNTNVTFVRYLRHLRQQWCLTLILQMAHCAYC